MEEIWKPVVGYEGKYEVSNIGRVRSLITLRRTNILSQHKTRKGYMRVGLHKGKKQKKVATHRLVAMAFIPNPQNLPQVNHKDENKQNNRVDNLEWCTNEYNISYGTAIERMSHTHFVPVIATDKDGNEIHFSSITEGANKMGVLPQSISSCCRRVLGTMRAGGYTWRYADDEKYNYYVEKRRMSAKKKASPVISTDKNGVDVYFQSIKEASEKTGTNRISIIGCCRKRKSAYHANGFKWRYATQEEKLKYSDSFNN